jgi:hypothetical protein
MADSTKVKRHYDALVRTGRVPTLVDIRETLPAAEPRIIEHLAAALQEAGHNAMLQRMAKKIESVAAAHGSLPEDIYVGKYPTGSFNAQVMKTTDGPLVLINTGTEFLIIEIVKLFAMGAIGLVKSAPDATDEEIRNAIGMTESEVSEQLARLLYAYVAQGDPAAARKLPMIQGELLIAVSKLAWATQEFLVAHEYGHIVKGHLRGLQARNAVDDGGELHLNWKSLEQEVEADATALQMCNALTFQETGQRIDDPAKLILLQMRFAGPTIFFALADLIEETFKSLVGKRGYLIVGGHPPSPMRLQYCNEYLLRIAGERALEVAKVFQNWVDHYKDGVIDVTQRLVQA